MTNGPDFGADTPESSRERDTLLERTGFKESSEMISLKFELIEALRTGDQERTTELYIKYRDLGEKIANAVEKDTSRGRIGLEISFARILQKAGRLEDCISALRDAYTIAFEEHFDEMAADIEKLIEETEKELEEREQS
jgi:hypothetical protein